jgi:lipoprotein-anchoring transpeptidase ErfK/SrfK
MLNQDIIDLWERVPKKSPIVVFGEDAPLAPS